MTGCYPERVSILGALGPTRKHGINADEITLAELCRSARLRHRHLRQMAPRPSPAIPAAAAWLRRVLRPAVFERHVAASSGCSTIVARSRPNEKRRLPPLPLFEDNEVVDPAVEPRRPGPAHDAIHRARRRLHRPQQGRGRSFCTCRTRWSTCRCTSPTSSAAKAAPACSAMS